jgi:hypothetical protein
MYYNNVLFRKNRFHGDLVAEDKPEDASIETGAPFLSLKPDWLDRRS